MIQLLPVTIVFVDAAFWLLLLVFFVFVYRRRKSRALLCLALYVAASLIATFVRQNLIGPFVSISKLPTIGGAVVMVPELVPVYLTACLMSLSDVCALLLVLSEITAMLREISSQPNPGLPRFLSAVHSHARLVGVAAVIFALASPVPTLVYLSRH